MAYVECWVSYCQPRDDFDAVLFPKDVGDFDGFMIANFMVREITNGVRLGRIAPGNQVIIKGKMISLSPAFRYLVRVQRQTGSRGEEFEILPEGGFRLAERLPLNWSAMWWILKYEVKVASPDAECYNILGSIGARSRDDVPEITEAMLTKQVWYPEMRRKSDYYRMEAVCKAKDAWPASLGPIRKLEHHQLVMLFDTLNERPHDLCYYGHSRHYKLGEMSYASLCKITNNKLTSKVAMGAACFYEMLKQERHFHGHTVFVKQVWQANFQKRNPAFISEASLQWLLREGHLLPLDKDARCVDKAEIFQEPSPVYYLQFPRDDLLKERILGHLRRIHENFRATEGKFTLRPPDDPVVAVPKGPLNEMQCKALDHVLNNPLTIINGGPGSGKTAFGTEHLSCLFQEIAVYTHVGRQAVGLCDRLGGSRENASTIHSAHHQRQKATHKALLRIKYSERIEILVIDEFYNCDDYTMEMAFGLASKASRVVLIGDRNQIMPIPGEEGAGTPAIDIAEAFPNHVVLLSENMRQQENARAIHDLVTAVRIKQPRSIAWSVPSNAVMRVDPPVVESIATLREVLFPMIKRLRQGIHRDEHAWQIITFYNGFKPGEQGLGAKQLNQIVEEYMNTHEGGRKQNALEINGRLSMYPGFKFMITEKFEPHKSLRPRGMNKKKPSAQGKMSKKMAAVGNGDTLYSETRNGQIEVVKSIRKTRVKDSSANAWIVDCEPKGRCVQGARLLINRALHVDPSAIQPAWAITSNKSMGGECKNVAVYIPTTIGRSFFDRSSLYVAVSRPIEWLGVVGRLKVSRSPSLD